MRPARNHRGAPPPTEVAVPPWLADDYVARYVRWRQDCEAVRHAYRLWQRADSAHRSWTLALYDAALDCEEEAAQELQRRFTLMCLWCV
jgi:hypothetical protein